LLSDALRFVLDVVPPSVSSTDPNLEIPLSTNRCGICPDASQELEKREDNENLLLSSNTAEYFPNKLTLLKFWEN
jgi:hypothetical protein